MVARPIVVRNNFQEGLDIIRIKMQMKTNGEALEDSIQMNLTLEGSRERINCSMTEYIIFLKEKA